MIDSFRRIHRLIVVLLCSSHKPIGPQPYIIHYTTARGCQSGSWSVGQENKLRYTPSPGGSSSLSRRAFFFYIYIFIYTFIYIIFILYMYKIRYNKEQQHINQSVETQTIPTTKRRKWLKREKTEMIAKTGAAI